MNSSNNTQSDPLQELFQDGKHLDYLAKEAVRDALREHKRLGQSIAVWQEHGRIFEAMIRRPNRLPFLVKCVTWGEICDDTFG